jgi:thioredoxin reductase/Pyruvate/2-oxoacid:ferredoxin oxidoreductase delta subunit
MHQELLYVVYGLPLAGIWFLYNRSGREHEQRSMAAKVAAIEAGLSDPPTLHPVIDPAKCLGCGACVAACPEGQILGLIGGKAQLIEPTYCIGHGACKAACPFDAISLVFGTEKRSVDIPMVGEDFQTNVPGLYIAGELGGMGLIRNAIEQGRQAVAAIASHRSAPRTDVLDLVVVGAGPAGFSASLAAKEMGLSCVTLEQDTLGGTVAHYPRGKLVMSAPATLPMVGRVHFREISKEALLEFWQSVQVKTGLEINFQERVEAITPLGEHGGFDVRTACRTYRTRALLLAIGRRGTPRTLDVAGEQLPKVVYRLIDPGQYAGRRVLVVGGGDSALEAAVSIAGQSGTTVTLSYRGDAFARGKPANRAALEALDQAGRVSILLNSSVTAISEGNVTIAQETRTKGARTLNLHNDAVIVCAGGILPSALLRDIGVEIETKYGTA